MGKKGREMGINYHRMGEKTVNRRLGTRWNTRLFDSDGLGQVARSVDLNEDIVDKDLGNVMMLTLAPFNSAMWYERSCSGMTVRMFCTQSTVFGTLRMCFMPARSSWGTLRSAMMIGAPFRATTCWRAFNDF